MMQSPLLGYTAFSHLLQRQGHQQKPMMASPSPGPHLGHGHLPSGHSGHIPGPGNMPRFLATSLLQRLPIARCPSTSPGSSTTPSPSCSPPAPSGLTAVPGHNKSFTIDAILGLRSHAAPSHESHQRFLGALRHHGMGPFHLHEPGAGPGPGASSPTDLSTSNRLSAAQAQPQAQPPSPRRTSSGSEMGVSVKKGSSSGGGKSKRVRTIFTAEQLERLEAEFERQQYMVGPERLYLAHALNLTEAQVKVWFQNRRIKWRKQHLEMQQQRLQVIKQQHQIQSHQPSCQLPQQQQQQQDAQHNQPPHMYLQQQQDPAQQQQQRPPHDFEEDSEVDSLSGDESTFPSMVIPDGMNTLDSSSTSRTRDDYMSSSTEEIQLPSEFKS